MLIKFRPSNQLWKSQGLVAVFPRLCFGNNQVSHNYITSYFIGIVYCLKYLFQTIWKWNNKREPKTLCSACNFDQRITVDELANSKVKTSWEASFMFRMILAYYLITSTFKLVRTWYSFIDPVASLACIYSYF